MCTSWGWLYRGEAKRWCDTAAVSPCRVLSHTVLFIQHTLVGSARLQMFSFTVQYIGGFLSFLFSCLSLIFLRGFLSVSSIFMPHLSLSAFLSNLPLFPFFFLPSSVLHQSKPTLSGKHRLKAYILTLQSHCVCVSEEKVIWHFFAFLTRWEKMQMQTGNTMTVIHPPSMAEWTGHNTWNTIQSWTVALQIQTSSTSSARKEEVDLCNWLANSKGGCSCLLHIWTAQFVINITGRLQTKCVGHWYRRCVTCCYSLIQIRLL